MTVSNLTIRIVIQPSYLRSEITVIIVKRMGKTEHAAFITVKKYTILKLNSKLTSTKGQPKKFKCKFVDTGLTTCIHVSKYFTCA